MQKLTKVLGILFDNHIGAKLGDYPEDVDPFNEGKIQQIKTRDATLDQIVGAVCNSIDSFDVRIFDVDRNGPKDDPLVKQFNIENSRITDAEWADWCNFAPGVILIGTDTYDDSVAVMMNVRRL